MEERHKFLLIQQNPQWSGELIELPQFKRDLYPIIKRYASYKQIIAVIGLRRAGKTILLKQLIRELEEPPKNICYISFDERDFQKYEVAFEAIYYFLQNSDKNKRRYLFLDEIQKIPNWPDLLKTIYDTEQNLKILISGSSSLELRGYKETLAGRILTFYLPVLTFKEFARYHGFLSEINLENLQREYDSNYLSNKTAYTELFQSYILKGAFPELLDKNDENYIKKYIREIIDKVIMDISKSIEPQRESEISDMINLFCKSTARKFEINNFSVLLKINRHTTARYIELLEKSFLIKTSYNYTKSIAKRLRVGKKGYIAHSCIPIALLNYPLSIAAIEGSDFGHLIETAVISNMGEVCFWSDQSYEVDIVLKDMPIEVKYQSQISKQDLKPLIAFMDRFKTKKSLLLTKDLTDIKKEGDKEIVCMPAWLFLLSNLVTEAS